MNITTPPSTPKKLKCPDAPKREVNHCDHVSGFGYITPVKRLFYDEKVCPWAPIKKNSSKKIYIRNENERVRIFFPPFDGKVTKRNLFGQPSKIPRLVKKNTPKFAESLKIKINLARDKNKKQK